METKKNQFIIFFLSLFISLFIYADNFFIPSQQDKLTCTGLKKQVGYGRSRGTWYYLNTNAGEFSVSEAVYNLSSVGGAILLEKSMLTKANREIKVVNDHSLVTCDIRFINETGLIYLSFITLLIILAMIFYERIAYRRGRKFLALYCAGSVIVILFFHLRGSLEF